MENPKPLSGKKIRIIAEALNIPAMGPRVLKLFLAGENGVELWVHQPKMYLSHFTKMEQLYGPESRSLVVMSC
jgi:hypothetical protein